MAFYKPRCAAILTVVFDARTTQASDNSPPQHIVVNPRECSVLNNGYHEADTWTLELDARALPFDPDSIAACNVRIFMWDDTDGYVGNRLDEMANVVGQLNQQNQAVPPGFTNQIVQKAYRSSLVGSIDSQFGRFEMIRGICDDDEGNMVGDDNTVKLSGRDYTAILMARNWDPSGGPKHTDIIPVGERLDQVVQYIADLAAPESSSARFLVTWAAEPGASDPSQIPICGSVHRGSKKEKGIQVKGEKNNWDVIYDLVLQHGFIAYVSGSEIIITDPATQTSDTLKSAPRLVYGKHLDSLSAKRKFGKDKVPQIIVRAYDPDNDEQIEVIYPAQSNVIVDGLAVQKNEQEYFPAPKGVIDKAALLRYARIMFYYKGRAETEYSFKTHCLSITAPDGTTTDLLRFKTGTAIGIKFDPFNKEHLLALGVEQRRRHIIALGYTPIIADFAANNMEKLVQYEQPYYLGSSKYDYNCDSGLEIEMTAYNFASQHRETHFADGPTYTLDTLNADAVSSG